MTARIYQPARNAMQSGQGNTKTWRLEFLSSAARSLDPLMGWTSSSDVQSQTRLNFESKEAAEAYAQNAGLDYTVVEPHKRKPLVRQGGYAENFAHNRRSVWTH